MTREERRLRRRIIARLVIGCAAMVAFLAAMYGMVYAAALWVM